jgi:hypothetical protein
MFIAYDLKYDSTKAGTECTHRDIGVINTDNIQSIEVTESALYIYFSDSHHIRFECLPIELYDAFTSLLSGFKTVCNIDENLNLSRIG